MNPYNGQFPITFLHQNVSYSATVSKVSNDYPIVFEVHNLSKYEDLQVPIVWRFTVYSPDEMRFPINPSVFYLQLPLGSAVWDAIAMKCKEMEIAYY